MIAVPLMDACTHVISYGMCPECRQKWMGLRRYAIGASEIAAVMGQSPWASRYSLFMQKSYGWSLDGDDQTEAQRWGHKLEDPIADEFAERHPDLEVVKPTHLLYRHPDVPWAVC